MKPLTLFSIFLISYGLGICAFEAIERHRVGAGGQLVPFDEDGEKVLVPGLGTVCLAGGVFLLVLSSGRRK